MSVSELRVSIRLFLTELYALRFSARRNLNRNVPSTSYEGTYSHLINKIKRNVLFSMVVSPYELRKNGWSSSSDGTDNLASIVLKDKEGNAKGSWSFPLTYSDNKYSLVLDAMMSAKVQDALSSTTDDNTRAAKALSETSSTSICRLKAVNESLANPQDIYATVKATGYTSADTS